MDLYNVQFMTGTVPTSSALTQHPPSIHPAPLQRLLSLFAEIHGRLAWILNKSAFSAFSCVLSCLPEVKGRAGA